MAKRDYKSYNIFEEESIAKQEEPSDMMLVEATENNVLSNAEKEHIQDIAEKEIVLQPGDNLLGNKSSKEKHKELENENLGELQRESKDIEELDKNTQGLDNDKQIEKQDEQKKQKKQRRFSSLNKLEEPLEHEKVKKSKQEKELHFPEYKRYYEKKERSALFRSLMLLAKIIITCMLLPLIGFIGCAVLFCIGMFLFFIAVCIGAGVMIIGIVAFMSTQISSSAIALGISIGVTSMALGGIILIIFLYIMKWLRDLFKRYKKPRKKMDMREEV